MAQIAWREREERMRSSSPEIIQYAVACHGAYRDENFRFLVSSSLL